jgi:hypothetical protein
MLGKTANIIVKNFSVRQRGAGRDREGNEVMGRDEKDSIGRKGAIMPL